MFSGAVLSTAWVTHVTLLAAYAACAYLINSSGVLRQLVHGLGTQCLNRCLSNRLCRHIVRLPLRFHLDRKTGAIGETLGQGLSGCQIVLQHAVSTFSPDISEGLAFLQKMLDMFREKQEGEAKGQGLAPAFDSYTVRGELVFEHVSFSYETDREILKDLSFHVPSERTLAIVGVSGSGKSSLIRLLFRLYEPIEGRVLPGDIPLSPLELWDLRNAIAVVPQDTALFNDSIGQNIAFDRPGATQLDIEHAAKLAHLHDFIVSLSDSYRTPVGEQDSKLSGGEKQRVATARAALKRPRILVFNGATSSLDNNVEREIPGNLIEISQNCTTLVAARRLSTVVYADQIVVLDRGVIIERGMHAEFLDVAGSYAALWRAQQSGRKELLEVVQSVA